MASYLQFCFIILLCGKDSPSAASISFQQQTLPVTGEDFTIECRYPPSLYPRSAQWRHEDIQVASESCTSTSTCTTTIPNPTKYKIMGDDRSTSLTIINLTADDNGRYTCDFLNKSGLWSADETIQVLSPAPPSQVSIDIAQSGNPISNSATIIVTSGEPYNITCNAYQARPPAVLTWIIPDDMIFYVHGQSDIIQRNKYVSSKRATITPSMNDQGNVLRCEASHSTLFTNLNVSVSLSVHVLPSSMTLFQSGIGKDNDFGQAVIYVQEGLPSSITCKCIGSLPAVEFVWKLGSSTILQDNISLQKHNNAIDHSLYDTKSIITFIPERKHHGKSIQCFASLGSFSERRFAKVLVKGTPDSIQIASLEDATLEEGMETNVTCRALNGYPAPSIHWYIGSRNITKDSSLQNTVNAVDRYDAESTLILVPNWLEHGKRLLCQAVQTTPISSISINESLILNVSYSPIVSITARRLTSLTSHKGSGALEFMLTCRADSNPPAIVFEWLTDETIVFNDTSNMKLHQDNPEQAERETVTTSDLMIPSRPSEHQSIYNCSAVSRYGFGSAVFNSSLFQTEE
ncbi:kin of IRRE-like protein 1 [Lytechinus variegatus]|uniref:kin of IRRE-like protein 1 n=1 Tax=Lytechinus variegatus TaxID=7654 RepID=UPI001BB23D9C|nr:kin of IRRE-like protein 1 [Lytechinus variegatus]